MKPLPPIERLTKLLSYNSHTGRVRRKGKGNQRKKGQLVGCKAPSGYITASVDNKSYLLHRIVWKLHTGNDPYPYQIDHINRKRDDNRIVNLRLVTHKEQMKNKGMNGNNKTGYKGVRKKGNRYEASITRNKKRHYFGMFDTPEEAHKAIIESDVYNT